MRERIAIAIVVLTLILLAGLAGIFGVRHNPAEDPVPAPSVGVPPLIEETAPPAKKSPGATVYHDQRCSACHALAGTGNPRYPLDGVGNRRDAGELRDWIVGTGTAAASLPGPVLRRKERYREMPPDEMAALIEFLAAQR